MKSKFIALFLLLLLVSGCYSSGYHPSYIMSEVDKEAPRESASSL